MKARNDTTINRLPAFWLSGSFVFCGIWLLVWLLYLPATDAGFVGDFYKDWLRIIREESFWHHINRPGSFTVYQFTQLLTYGFYRLFGDYPPAWHILHVTMHAFCAVALYTFFRQLLRDSRLKSPEATSLIVTVLFAVSAYNSEVIVHEPCLHYTFGFLLLLLPLIWMQHYFNSQKPRYLWWAVLIFVPASYAIEVFYLTPWLILSLCIFYVYVLQRDKKVLKKSFLFLVLPSLLIFFAHILVLRAFTGTAASHQVSTSLLTLLEGYWNKVLKYVFHILFMGRFFSHDVRKLVYNYCQSGPVIILSHVLLIGAFAYYFAVASRTGKRYPLILLFSLWAMAFIALVSPREFPQGQLVSLDRYIYFMLPFMLMIVALCFSARCRSLGIFLFLAYFTVNIYLLLKVNRYWRDSNRVVESLYRSFPSPDGRITLLLNNPVNMQGVHMIGANFPSAFALAYELNSGRKIGVPVYDVAAYNMITPDDGAHVNVVNDSTIKVTLNQWGTWWWYRFQGAVSYDNEDFKLDMRDVGHWYELTLHKPADSFLLLYSVGGTWKTVDMNKKDVDQN